MRVHKARGAAYDLDKERQYNWWKAKPGRKLNGSCHHLSRSELQAFAESNGLILSDNATFRAVRHG
jgi:hypothetical protein